MELSDYLRILRRWKILIVAGTILSLFIGLGMVEVAKASQPARYVGTASVQVNYVSPSYQNLSLSAEATALSQHIHDPGAISTNPRVTPPGYVSISDSVDPNADTVISISAIATSPTDAVVIANHAAAYLVHFEDSRVRTLARSQRLAASRQVALTRRQWLKYLARYNQANGPPPLLGRSALATLLTTVEYWQDAYHQALGTFQGLATPIVPPAGVVTSGQFSVLKTKSPSVSKTLLPAVVLGFLLSFGLAALLDYTEGDPAAALRLLKGSSRPKTQLRVPVLGNLQHSDILADGAQPGPMALDALCRSAAPTAAVLARVLAADDRVVYVTSPTAALPKPETTIGLAAALASQGHSVVLVDADPSAAVTRFFGLQNQPGLRDHLADPAGSVESLLLRFHREFGGGILAILPIGLPSTSPSAERGMDPLHGSSAAWPALLDEARAAGDIVLIHGEPVLDRPPDAALASKAGAIMVIHREQADDDVVKAHDALLRLQARLLGLVVNASPGRLALTEAMEQGVVSPPRSRPSFGAGEPIEAHPSSESL